MLRAVVAVAAAGMLALVSGCTASEPEAPAPAPEPTRVVVGVVGSLTSFNPLSTAGATPGNRAVADYLHESFAYLDDQLQVVGNGGFGEVERVSADPLRVQYTLFAGRTWSDGTPVTVDDLLFGWAVHSGWFDDATFDASGTLVSGTRYFDVAESTDGIRETRRPLVNRSDNAVTLIYDAPFADWNREWLLDRPVHLVAARAGVSVDDLMSAIRTTARGNPLAPVAPNPVLLAAAQAWNTGFAVDPSSAVDLGAAVSNGPYAAESWDGTDLVLTRNTAYVGNHQPQFDHLVLRYLPDEQALLQAVADGEVDVANLGDATAAELARLRTAGAEVYTGARPETLNLVFVDEGATLDPAVREALVLALDRERIVDESVRSIDPGAQPLQSFLGSSAQGKAYDELVSGNGLPGPAPDLPAAEALVDGAAPVVRIRYEPIDVIAADVFAEIAGMAREAGISVRPAGDSDAADAQLASFDVSGSVYDAARERTRTGAGGQDAADAVADMRTRSDPEEAVVVGRGVDRALYEDGYGIPLLARAGAVAASGSVQGVSYTAGDGAPRYFWTWAPRTP